MSYEAWGDGGDQDANGFTEDRVIDFWRYGLQVMREMQARFVEQGGDATMANSIRMNWNPSWGKDPGKFEGEIPADPWNA
jgi:hypothetical protein